MRRTLKWLLATLLTSFVVSSAYAGGLDGAYTQPTMVVIPEDDPELLAAKKQARDTLDQFMARLQRRTPHDLDFAVRVVIGSGPTAQAMWVSQIEHRGEWLVGRIDAAPAAQPTLKTGEVYRLKAEDITDWTILERTLTGERLLGGTTLKLQEARELRGLVPDTVAFQG